MRLRTVSVSHYKNLHDFSLTFTGNEFIDILVGKNGSGKSNFLEALIEIFDHIYGLQNGGADPNFEYEIVWEIADNETRIAWLNGGLWINGVPRQKIGRTPLPANIIVYYSGQNETVGDLVRRYRDSYRRSVRSANVADIPRFIGIGPDYKAILLALMLMQPEGVRARHYLCAKLGIEHVGATALLTLRRPSIAAKKRTYDPFDEEQLFWGVKGIARAFLDQLLGCITGSFTSGSLYDRGSDTYELNIDVARFRAAFADVSPDVVFCYFNALHALGMIVDMAIPVRLAANTEVSSRAFSDGQFQSIYLFAISELFKNRECLTLLDEPDAFLHPEWQYEFLGQVLAISEQAARTNHILMSSHSASTIAGNVDARLRIFEVADGVVTSSERDKGALIATLSAGLINFSEQEARLNIQHVLKNTRGPIVFTEGISDEVILETAWKKLYPGREKPFEIQGTFGCNFLGALLREDSIYAANPGRLFFGVFDFDEAYNNWNSKHTVVVQADLARGLVRKKASWPGYFILLPVPHMISIRNQVVDAVTGAHFGGASLLPMELLFHDVPNLGHHFADDHSRPGKCRRFQGSKVQFASAVVPHLGAEHFECFRPIFEFIETEIAAQAIAEGVLSSMADA
ncbi:AAA family ATPase [Terricaulis sp.]|uniref:AAA family ATPase n=1 Tax=Terricaulis sp. TaxID=2768686 RepID=UPI00378328D8